MVGERKRKTPEGLSAVDTPPPSLSLLGSFAHAKPRRPFNERNLLFAGSSTCTCYETTRCSAYDSRSGLAPPLPRPLSLSVSLPMSTACFHDRDARVACILRHEDFAVSRGKDNPLYVSACLAHPVGPWRAVTSQRSAKGNYQCGGSTSWKH